MLKITLRSFKNRVTRQKPLVQSGGTLFLTTYAGREIYIRETQMGTIIAVYGGRNPPTKKCFTILIEDEDDGQKSAILNDVGRDNGCFLDDLSNSRDLVNVAVKFALERYNIVSLNLSDNSTIKCPEHVYLSNLSLVTTGFTWYQSCIPGLLPEKPEERALFTHWQSLVNTVSWDALWDYLSKHDVSPPPGGFDTTHIDTASQGSAKTVLNRLKQSKRGCSFFSEHMTRINEGFGIKALPEPISRPKQSLPNLLHGWSWIVHFTNSSHSAITRKQKRTLSSNRGKTRKSKSSAPV